MSAKLLTTGSAKVRKIKPAKAKAGGSVAGGGRNETGHLQNSNSFHERYAAARGLSRVLVKKMPPAGKWREAFFYPGVFMAGPA